MCFFFLSFVLPFLCCTMHLYIVHATDPVSSFSSISSSLPMSTISSSSSDTPSSGESPCEFPDASMSASSNTLRSVCNRLSFFCVDCHSSVSISFSRRMYRSFAFASLYFSMVTGSCSGVDGRRSLRRFTGDGFVLSVVVRFDVCVGCVGDSCSAFLCRAKASCLPNLHTR